jgi:cell division protein FtsI/penicillin-binding protein 2
VQPNARVACPGQTTVYGKVFHNEDSFDLGTVPLRSAFAHSCNTTFTSLSTGLTNRALTDMAARFGVGAGWSLPLTTFSGSIPVPSDDAERAADAIGQGRVLVSPLTMALVAATVAHGSTPAPSIVTDQPAPARNEPDAPSAATLMTVKSFMRATVTEGTATQLAGVVGPPVYGKTGTAEYGTATPPHSHAWFAGFRGDLAFAVFVQGGESSKTTAVPIAASFLNHLQGLE